MSVDEKAIEIAEKLKGKEHLFYWKVNGRRFNIKFIVQEMIDDISYETYIDDLYWKWKEEGVYTDDVNEFINYFRKKGVWCELEEK